MSTKVQYKKKTATKKNRAKSKGTARRKTVSVRNKGASNVTVATSR